jgi:hypothetical protein
MRAPLSRKALGGRNQHFRRRVGSGDADVARVGPFRFFFYSNEGTEPAHIHAQRERKMAKFWLEPVALTSSGRFSASELRSIERIVLENKDRFLEAWNEFFRR